MGAETKRESIKATPKAESPKHCPHRLDAPYAYFEDDGTLKSWGQGLLVTDHDEIQHLKDRGARLIEVKP